MRHDKNALNKCEKVLREIEEKPSFTPSKKGNKIIHDPLFGTQVFYSHEIRVIDLQIFQRLRRIKQMGFCYLLYPGAQHTRFEHSLGACDILERLYRVHSAMNTKLGENLKLTYNTLRIAAILHDVGHVPFSHDLEIVLEEMSFFRNQRRKYFPEAKPHEILTYYIINTSYFQEVLASLSTYIEREKVGDLIVGRPPNNDPSYKWLTSLINGVLDVDKLDYLRRDAYYTGLPITIDLDRLFHSLDIESIGDGQDIIITHRGVPALEQAIFNKIFLFSTVYHHHKTRSAACMFAECVRRSKFYKEIAKNPFILLKYDDSTIIDAIKCDENEQILKDIQNRRLLKRGIIISQTTVKGGVKSKKEQHPLTEFWKIREDPKLKEDLESEIRNELGIEEDKLVIADSPKPVGIREAQHSFIKHYGIVERVGKLLALDHWLGRFSELKASSHIFIPPEFQTNDNYNKIVKVLKDFFGLEFKSVAKPW